MVPFDFEFGNSSNISLESIETYQSNGSSSEKAEKHYEAFSGPKSRIDIFLDKAWRHVAGRISMLARIPIYLVAIGIQAAKISLKVVVAPFVTLVNWGTGGRCNKTLDSWTLYGVAKDSLVLLKLFDKVGSSVLGTIFAPPKQYIPIDQVPLKTFKILCGNYHFTDSGRVSSVSDVWMMVRTRPEYHRHIIDHDSLNLGVFLKTAAG